MTDWMKAYMDERFDSLEDKVDAVDTALRQHMDEELVEMADLKDKVYEIHAGLGLFAFIGRHKKKLITATATAIATVSWIGTMVGSVVG